MAEERTTKINFDRRYYKFNPNRYTGSPTYVLDTIVKPTRKPEDDIYRNFKV